jgi:lipopolysaccharide export system protein LptC
VSAYDATTEGFAMWEPARLLTLEEARKRTRLIRVWRWVCVTIAAAAGMSVLGFAAWASVGGDMGFKRQLAANDALKMVNPRFTGRANNGGSYVLVADTATRRSRISDTVDLDKPLFEGSRGGSARAPKGVYKESTGNMELSGGVVFMDKSGNRFDTVDAFFDSAKDKVTGTGSINGSGPIGSLRADTYEMQASGGRVVMRGNVRGTIKESEL